MHLFQFGEGSFGSRRRCGAHEPASPSGANDQTHDGVEGSSLLAANRLVTSRPWWFGQGTPGVAVGEAELPHRQGGVWFVDLTAVMSGADVPIASAVGWC
jgi:hypothetical protein